MAVGPLVATTTCMCYRAAGHMSTHSLGTVAKSVYSSLIGGLPVASED